MEFRVLGAVEVRDDTQRVVRIPAARVRTLLAALLLRPFRAVPVEDLVERLWGDKTPANPSATIHTYVNRLRGYVGADLVQTRSGGYLIAAAPGDLVEFRRLVESAPHAADAVAERELLGRAVGLWRGAPLSNVVSPSLTRVEAPQLLEERLAAVERWYDVRLRLGEHADVVADLTASAREHPLRERFHGQLMLALHRSGRQADALAVFDDLAKTLAEELGLDPAPELRRLRQAILVNAAELDVEPPDDGPTGVSAGWTPQFQLPLDVADFVGRDALVDRVELLLSAAGGVPIVALEGPPGVGKTALALRVAHRLRPAFPDGQWFVGLRGASEQPSDPARVLEELLRLSGLPQAAVPADPEARSALLRARLADRRVLMFFDDARDAEQVRPLLPGAAGSTVLITSRREMWNMTALHGAHNVHVDVLDPGEAGALLERMLGTSAIQAEPEATAALVGLCGSLPLALRIAAANIASRGEQQIGRYVTDLRRGNTLAGLAIAGDPQVTVRAAFDLSYAALDRESQLLFRLLGLVPGPDFSAGAAAALLGTGQDRAAGLLEGLAAANLVLRRSSGRYLFHDLVRLYAAERVADDDGRNDAVERLYAWYLRTADAACDFGLRPAGRLAPPVEPVSAGPETSAGPEAFAGPEEGFEWLEAERPNLLAAIHRAADAGPAAYAWQLADALRGFLSARRLHDDWRKAMNDGLRAARAAGDRAAQGAMLGSLGALAHSVGDVEAAVAQLTTGAGCHGEAGNVLGEALLTCNLGNACADHGQLRRGAELLRRGIEMLRSIDRADLLDIALLNLAKIAADLGDLDEAIECATGSLAVSRWADLRRSALLDRGALHHLTGAAAAAEADLAAALAIEGEVDEAAVKVELARLYRDTGRPDLARELATQALDETRRADRRLYEAEALNVLGEVCSLESGYAEAGRCHLEALATAELGSYGVVRATALLGLATASRGAGDRTAAETYARQAVQGAQDLGLRVLQCRALLVLAALDVDAGRPDEAIEHQAAAKKLQQQTGYRPPS